MKKSNTSWESSEKWYDQIVGEKGHYYHEHVVIPGIMDLFKLKKGAHLLDLGCGNGALARHLPRGVNYFGVDASNSLIQKAKSYNQKKGHQFKKADVTKPLQLKEKFSHASFILSLQNMEDPIGALKNASDHLEKKGQLLLVLNHPSFRIPRQSAWAPDLDNKILARKMNCYLNPLKIPITTHPGKKNSPVTYSFHHSLSFYSKSLYEMGFVIEVIDEWCSDKKSTGKYAKMENRARKEFPLFMAIRARKE